MGERNDDVNVKWKLNGKDEQLLVPANAAVPKEFEVPSNVKPDNLTVSVYKADRSGQTFFNRSVFYFVQEFLEMKPTAPIVLVVGGESEKSSLIDFN